ncbi:hypothetical protein PCE1_004157 [Barthelona sp. PCE]
MQICNCSQNRFLFITLFSMHLFPFSIFKSKSVNIARFFKNIDADFIPVIDEVSLIRNNLVAYLEDNSPPEICAASYEAYLPHMFALTHALEVQGSAIKRRYAFSTKWSSLIAPNSKLIDTAGIYYEATFILLGYATTLSNVTFSALTEATSETIGTIFSDGVKNLRKAAGIADFVSKSVAPHIGPLERNHHPEVLPEFAAMLSELLIAEANGIALEKLLLDGKLKGMPAARICLDIKESMEKCMGILDEMVNEHEKFNEELPRHFDEVRHFYSARACRFIAEQKNSDEMVGEAIAYLYKGQLYLHNIKNSVGQYKYKFINADNNVFLNGLKSERTSIDQLMFDYKNQNDICERQVIPEADDLPFPASERFLELTEFNLPNPIFDEIVLKE